MKRYGNPESLARAPEQVLFERRADGIARITLNRPEKHNAMTVPMRTRLMELIHACEEDAGVRVVVIAGNGKSFCSGNEINEDWGQRAPGQKRMSLSMANRYASDLNYGRQGFSQAITRCSKPTVLRLHGYCAAAAYFMIGTRCDMVVVSPGSKIGALEARFLGPAGAVSATHINRILGTKAARRFGYTGAAMSGEDALRLGLAHSCVPDDRMDEEVERIARRLASQPGPIVEYCKSRIRAAESLFQTNVREVSGLLFSHFLQADHDEAHFWTKVKESGVSGALQADKARLAASTVEMKAP
ncbi:MAG TPA: enoyl-CoA hydratase/isomerase family protein [Ramlibacter sp.]|uniref:enoyl-CoA hydratase/isomerase family protein n=1 Tax=Ramlibacter sp. TaxID=1917967 RepID=UPI002BB2D550|nr:enoyl-CoA hydratase/isomerase family protein [Ramlibacter sp.]HVZ42219.1 enoyl-CoA hydratase/isomerase family protein [Ramlibacter sp.]